MKFKKMRKALTLLLATVMTVGVVACGNGEGDNTVTNVEVNETDTQVASETTEPTADNTEAKVYEGMRTELTSLEFVELMGNGINLGNTMEAYGRQSFGVGATTTAYETFWGQPVTTQEMISGMKAAGFDTLRIPVAWTNAMKFETGDYTIGADYLDRVEEIVNYALKEDMYVIINDHWDGGWWGMFGSASEETRKAAMDLYISMWTQIGERFKDYSDHVIFESGNEELGFRLNDKDIATDSGALTDAQCYEMTNKINQQFVDTIRGTGGNNEVRFLLIAGFGTDITNTCNDQYKMPTDTADSKLLLSVHYYDPSGYCIQTSLATWGTKRDYEDQIEKLEMMKKFTDQGYGIVIGEYGVLMNNKQMKENTLEYTTNFLNNCDIYGYCPVLWDCNDMYSRTDCKIVDQGMADLFTEHSYAVQSTKNKEDLIAKAKTENAAALEAAPEAAGVDDRTAKAWIMYTSSDWSIQYSVGDTYDPGSATAGIVATDVEITGEGTYTVALDFTGTSAGFANSTTFAAVGIANGEALYPGYAINIKEILVNGEPYKISGGRPYTCSDDGLCTRVNLYNAWVTAVDPEKARVASGPKMYLSPTIMDAANLGNVETISVTFDYVAGN
ncbi:MAG: glycoside hydrolase family 5 protein [Lachnospiraceae bacterium]|nr:glycoside hydrolase family 5 protein [Lachnospiraceae bacterium]